MRQRYGCHSRLGAHFLFQDALCTTKETLDACIKVPMFYKFHSDTWKEIIFDTVFPVMFPAVYRFYQSLTCTSTAHQTSRTGQPWCYQQGNHLMAPRLTLNNFRILQQPILPQMKFKSLVTRCSLHCIHRCSVRVLSRYTVWSLLILLLR